MTRRTLDRAELILRRGVQAVFWVGVACTVAVWVYVLFVRLPRVR